ncbi:AAA family ATPase [Mycolicibacterium fluoranthenivorans]|uniref:AAA family ATPase n=1 Tax=Mycolicibacterium fluoranthenivorans TaxID=258505 RepID=A0A7G8PAG6_9MYCO|nr:AAA family ATPase [Mycolicibacterium fluoranthenivorans]QNJ91332.1 AAA family ATPase [Mycolicibacterium fluoranthenivorans]
MKISGIAIQKYRSIKRSPRLDLGDLTVLIGPNNEGKSNVLRALAVSMRIVRTYGFPPGNTREGRPSTRRPLLRGLYDWSDDFPKDLQEKTPDGNSIIDLWFELDAEEQAEFHARVGSKLKTELPIRLTIGARNVEFAVRKQGPGAVALTRKAGLVAEFVGQSLRVEHVESVRTAARAKRVVEDMVGFELTSLRGDEGFSAALETLVDAVKPVAERLSADLAATLKAFLPDVKGVEVALGTDRIFSALSSQVQITVDDGVSTELQHKGDGVQSLAALALIRKAAEVRRGALVLAIEEPEAHLHPRAIHQLRDVLSEIAVSQQVVLTTHSGALVDRRNLSNNILVRANRATPATSLEEIRNALGIRVGDNMSNADLVLVVEGGCDSKALVSLLGHLSVDLANALTGGAFAIESLGSASYLSARLDALSNVLSRVHVLVDNDDEGRLAAEKARRLGLLSAAEENLTTVPGMKNSEFEDVLDPTCYTDAILQRFGVDLNVKEFKHSRAKWSDRVERAFISQGKTWNDFTKTAVKAIVAMEVAQNPGTALHPKRSTSIHALVQSLDRRLADSGPL